MDKLSIPRGDIDYVYDPNKGNLAEVISPDGGKITFDTDGSLLTQFGWVGYPADSTIGTLSGTVNQTFDVV